MKSHMGSRIEKLEVHSVPKDTKLTVDEIWLTGVSPSGEDIEPVLYWSRHDKTIHLGEKI